MEVKKKFKNHIQDLYNRINKKLQSKLPCPRPIKPLVKLPLRLKRQLIERVRYQNNHVYNLMNTNKQFIEHLDKTASPNFVNFLSKCINED